MTSKNDITGDDIKSKTPTDKYREGWDRIFGQKKKKEVPKKKRTPKKDKDTPV